MKVLQRHAVVKRARGRCTGACPGQARGWSAEASRNYVLFEILPWALAHPAILGYTGAKMRNSLAQPPSPRADLAARTGPRALMQKPPCWFVAALLC
jgi:hypothetical protein